MWTTWILCTAYKICVTTHISVVWYTLNLFTFWSVSIRFTAVSHNIYVTYTKRLVAYEQPSNTAHSSNNHKLRKMSLNHHEKVCRTWIECAQDGCTRSVRASFGPVWCQSHRNNLSPVNKWMWESSIRSRLLIILRRQGWTEEALNEVEARALVAATEALVITEHAELETPWQWWRWRTLSAVLHVQCCVGDVWCYARCCGAVLRCGATCGAVVRCCGGDDRDDRCKMWF